MATAAVLTERAESLGLPITKNAFEGTLENPVPPYLTWFTFCHGKQPPGRIVDQII